MAKKNKKRVVATSTNEFYKFNEGDEFQVLREFWDNGEFWYLLLNEDGKEIEIPSIFLDDVEDEQ